MEKDNYLDIFDSKEKAIHHYIWLNFKYRIAKIKFGIINGPDNNFAVVEEATANEMEMTFLISCQKIIQQWIMMLFVICEWTEILCLI